MEKVVKKNNYQKYPSNKPDANPNPQNKAKFMKRSWNDYLEKHDEFKVENKG